MKSLKIKRKELWQIAIRTALLTAIIPFLSALFLLLPQLQSGEPVDEFFLMVLVCGWLSLIIPPTISNVIGKMIVRSKLSKLVFFFLPLTAVILTIVIFFLSMFLLPVPELSGTETGWVGLGLWMSAGMIAGFNGIIGIISAVLLYKGGIRKISRKTKISLILLFLATPLIVIPSLLPSLLQKLALETQQESMCRFVTQRHKPYCYEDIAVDTKNFEVCDKIDSPFYKSRCYTAVLRVVGDKNEKVCRNIPSKQERGICYRKVAEDKENSTLCAKIEYTEQRNYCYKNLAKMKRDGSLCQNVERGFDRDQCYFGVACQTGNATLCEKIERNYKKKDCRRQAKRSPNMRDCP